MGTEYQRVAIEGFEGRYEVDALGNVYSLIHGIKLKPNDSKCPYYHVHLMKSGKRYAKKIHRLVAEAFIPNPDNLPQVNHKDENKHNNNVDNLEWCTALYNTRYGTGIERAKANRVVKPKTEEEKKHLAYCAKEYWKTHKHPRKQFEIECLNDHRVYYSYSEVGRAYGISYKWVRRMCEDGREVRGYRFRYLKEAHNEIRLNRRKKGKVEM